MATIYRDKPKAESIRARIARDDNEFTYVLIPMVSLLQPAGYRIGTYDETGHFLGYL